MTERPDQHACANCAKLEAKIAKLDAKNAKLETRLAAWESDLTKAKNNLSNSSKPPSSDMVHLPPTGGKRGRRSKHKRGGQPGHAHHDRTPFPLEERAQQTEAQHAQQTTQPNRHPPRLGKPGGHGNTIVTRWAMIVSLRNASR